MESRHVVIVAFHGLQPLDAVGPFEVFAGATKAVGGDGYRPVIVSASGGLVRTESGLFLRTDPLPPPDDPADTLILAGGAGVHRAGEDAVLLNWITSAAGSARRVATVCTGAFLAAEAGLLTGRRVTTHWAMAGRLAREYPEILVDSDPIYVRDGRYWSSAGVTAGIDLALALVEQDLGAPVAQMVARWLVMFVHRPGGQSQFATPTWVPRADRSAVRMVQELIEADPAGDHRMPALAQTAAMSVRHFARIFKAETGQSPGRFVERVRVEAARRRLEEAGDTLGVVARACGFGSQEALRRAFHRHVGVPPDAYRRRFSHPPERNPV